MSIVAEIGVAGLRAAQTRFAARAENIANANTPGFAAAKPEQTSTAAGPVVRVSRVEKNSDDSRGPAVDIARELVEARVAQRDFEASAQILRTEQEVSDRLLDIRV